MGQRTWIKIFCENWLEGTLRNETPELRGVWIDVLVLVGNLTYGDNGEIKLPGGIGLTDEQIAAIFNISYEKWMSNKEKLINTDRIVVLENNIIKINNWQKYQSEYQRQKFHRKKLQPKVTTKSYNQKLQAEVTVEKEKEKENTTRISNTSINSSIARKKYLSLRERILKVFKNYFPNTDIPEAIPTNRIDFFLYLIEQNKIDTTKVRDPVRYIQSRKLVLEPFPSLLEREAEKEKQRNEEDERLKKEREDIARRKQENMESIGEIREMTKTFLDGLKR